MRQSPLGDSEALEPEARKARQRAALPAGQLQEEQLFYEDAGVRHGKTGDGDSECFEVRSDVVEHPDEVLTADQGILRPRAKHDIGVKKRASFVRMTRVHDGSEVPHDEFILKALQSPVAFSSSLIHLAHPVLSVEDRLYRVSLTDSRFATPTSCSRRLG